MTIDYTSLMEYISSLNSDGTLSDVDLNRIIQYIIDGGLYQTINLQKTNNGGIF